MPRLSGVTGGTYNNMVYDTGAVYVGFTDFSNPGTLIGATVGGTQLKVTPEWRKIEVDGARGPVVGGRRIVNLEAQLVVNLIEWELSTLLDQFPASVNSTFDTNYDEITRTDELETSDYLSNIVVIYQVANKNYNGCFRIDNALMDQEWAVNLEDKTEAVLPLTFTGHFSPSALYTEPWKLYHPKS